jgi:hypothetical protein
MFHPLFLWIVSAILRRINYTKDENMAVSTTKIDAFVNKFVYQYLGRDIEFSDVYEDEDTKKFSREQLREAHGKIMDKLDQIQELYKP